MINTELFALIADIDENKITDAENIKRRKPVWMKIALAAACIALIGTASLPIINNFMPRTIGVNSPIVEYVGKPEDKQIHLPCIRATLLIVNEADAVICADMAVDAKCYDGFVKLTDSAVSIKEKIPSSWELEKVFSLSLPADEEKRKFHDLVYLYKTDSGGEVRIATCSFEEPLSSTILHCEEPVTSFINGVDVIACSYENMYTAEFKYENVYYNIWTENVTLSALDELVVSLTLNFYNPTKDVPADDGKVYFEAVKPGDLTGEISGFFGGSYIDEKGQVTVVLTKDTKQNRKAVLKELNLNEKNTVFKKGKYTLEYLMEVHTQISNSMTNKELPYVVSCGVYEIENKVKVGVITNDKKELEKIKAFDTFGGAIEIEFSSKGTNDLYTGR